MKKSTLIYLLSFVAITFLAACSGNKIGSTSATKVHLDTLLTRFDSLDFDVYSNQRWNDLHLSHAEDILVHYPDGHTSKGIPTHIDELKKLFVFAPDTKIKVHPVRFGSEDYTPRNGDWTSVVGVMEGTFSNPMPEKGGKLVSPTGKHFKLQMVTVGHWKNGKMDEEYLFWDNLSFMQQLGVTK